MRLGKAYNFEGEQWVAVYPALRMADIELIAAAPTKDRRGWLPVRKQGESNGQNLVEHDQSPVFLTSAYLQLNAERVRLAGAEVMTRLNDGVKRP